MAKSTSPFAGKKLTGITSPANTSIEQRLFSNSPIQAGTGKPKEPEETKEPSKVATLQARKQATLEPRNLGNLENEISEDQGFDLGISPYQNDTFAFTTEELDAIEDLKIELKRKIGVRATKNDIIRCGVHSIIEDYRQHGAESLIVNRIRNKRPR